jgi:hypothetical protein
MSVPVRESKRVLSEYKSKLSPPLVDVRTLCSRDITIERIHSYNRFDKYFDSSGLSVNVF